MKVFNELLKPVPELFLEKSGEPKDADVHPLRGTT